MLFHAALAEGDIRNIASYVRRPSLMEEETTIINHYFWSIQHDQETFK